jgi:hypothetical protein
MTEGSFWTTRMLLTGSKYPTVPGSVAYFVPVLIVFSLQQRELFLDSASDQGRGPNILYH